MRSYKLISIIFLAVVCSHYLPIKAQNLDRISISSGGASTEELHFVIGEVFNFTVDSGGVSFDAGSVSDENNTGGDNHFVEEPDPDEIIDIIQKEIDVLVYPNPTSYVLNIQVNFDVPKVSLIEIYDLSGRKVLSLNVIPTNHYVIDVSALPSGLYLAVMMDKSRMTYTKIKFSKM